jgi:hypothetical protein
MVNFEKNKMHISIALEVTTEFIYQSPGVLKIVETQS